MSVILARTNVSVGEWDAVTQDAVAICNVEAARASSIVDMGNLIEDLQIFDDAEYDGHAILYVSEFDGCMFSIAAFGDLILATSAVNYAVYSDTEDCIVRWIGDALKPYSGVPNPYLCTVDLNVDSNLEKVLKDFKQDTKADLRKIDLNVYADHDEVQTLRFSEYFSAYLNHLGINIIRITERFGNYRIYVDSSCSVPAYFNPDFINFGLYLLKEYPYEVARQGKPLELPDYDFVMSLVNGRIPAISQEHFRWVTAKCTVFHRTPLFDGYLLVSVR